MTSAPSKLALALVLLIALWIVAYWITPEPTDQPVRISFGESPEPEHGSLAVQREAAHSAPGPAPAERDPPPHAGSASPVGNSPALTDADVRADTESAPTDHAEYVVQRGDTLSDIARALYGRASLWPRIRDANPGVDPERLRPGAVLRIPPPPAT